jgi:hypothetical protein
MAGGAKRMPCFSGLDWLPPASAGGFVLVFDFLACFSALLVLGFSLAGKSRKKPGCLAKQRLKPRREARLKPASATAIAVFHRLKPEAGGNQSSRLKPATRQNF